MALTTDTLFHVSNYAEILVDSLFQESIEETLVNFNHIVSFCYTVINLRWETARALGTHSSCNELARLLAYPDQFRVLQLSPLEYTDFRMSLMSLVLRSVVNKLEQLRHEHPEQLPQLNPLLILTLETLKSMSTEIKQIKKQNLGYALFAKSVQLVTTAAVGTVAGMLGFHLGSIYHSTSTAERNASEPLNSAKHYPILILCSLLMSLVVLSCHRPAPTPSDNAPRP